MAQEKQVYVRLRSKTTGQWFVHPGLRGRLIRDAAVAETSLTDLVNRILAARFQVPYDPSGRRSRPSDQDEEQLTLRIAEPILRALKLAAANSGGEWQDTLRRTLCDYYQLAVPAAA